MYLIHEYYYFIDEKLNFKNGSVLTDNSVMMDMYSETTWW
jgi:hypothetical protein